MTFVDRCVLSRANSACVLVYEEEEEGEEDAAVEEEAVKAREGDEARGEMGLGWDETWTLTE